MPTKNCTILAQSAQSAPIVHYRTPNPTKNNHSFQAEIHQPTTNLTTLFFPKQHVESLNSYYIIQYFVYSFLYHYL
jgi:hypothetical protein